MMRRLLFTIALLTFSLNSLANEKSCKTKNDCVGYTGCTSYYVKVCNKENIASCKQKLDEHCSKKGGVKWNKPSQEQLNGQIQCVKNECTINNIWLNK